MLARDVLVDMNNRGSLVRSERPANSTSRVASEEANPSPSALAASQGISTYSGL